MELEPDDFTVLIIDDDADGAVIRELADDWHAQGLLKEFALVSPASVTEAAYGPALVHASVVGHDGQTELMRHLGSRRRRLIRLIVLHPLTHADSSADALVAVCDEVATLVKRAMPVAVSASGDGVRLLRMNLLVPETDLAPQQTSILQPGWEVNAVVSPEDRPDLDRLNVFIRASDNLHGHALAAAATVGALWRGMHEAAFDRTEMDSTTGSHDIMVIRCQAKIVVGDDRAARLSSAAVTAVAGVPDGAVRYIKWGFVSDRPAQLVDTTLERLLREPDFAKDEREFVQLSKAEVSLGQLIRDWFSFQASLPVAALDFFGSRAQSAVERGVTNTFAGEDAGVTGRVRPMAPDVAASHATARLRNLSRALEPRRLEEDAATWGQSTPGAWRTLRELAVGLVDGSELPAAFNRQRRSELDEVLPPSYVTPAPDDSGPFAGVLRGVDVAHVAVLGAELLEVQQAGLGTDAKPAAKRKPKPTSKNGGDDPVTKQESLEDAAVEESAASEPTAAPGPTTDQLSEWVDGRRRSLFWQLADRVYGYRRDEHAKTEAALQGVRSAQEAPPSEALSRARKLLITSWITSLGLITLGAYLIWAMHTDPWGTWLWHDARVAILVWAGIIVAVFLAGGHQYYLALKKYEWQVRLRLHTLRAASDEYVAASHQEKRWALMYEGVLDWNDILAELLHRPWAERTTPTPNGEVDPRGLPAAVALAVPAETAVDPSPDLVAEAVESMCFRGWLREEFDHVVSRSYANDSERNNRSGDLPADLDLGLRDLGPRRELLNTIRDPHGRETSTLGVYDVIAQRAAEGEIRVPDLRVKRIGEYSGGEVEDHKEFIAAAAQPTTPFSPDVFSDQALVSKRHMPASTALSVPVGVAVPQSGSMDVRQSDASLATRVDVSETLQPSDVKLFQRGPRVVPVAPIDSAREFN